MFYKKNSLFSFAIDQLDHLEVGAFRWGLLKAIRFNNDSNFDSINPKGIQFLTHSRVSLNDF